MSNILSWLRDRGLHLPASKNSVDDVLGSAVGDLLKSLGRTAIDQAVTQAIGDGAVLIFAARPAVIAGVIRVLGGDVPPVVREAVRAAVERAFSGSVGQSAERLRAAVTNELYRALKLEQ